MVDLGVSPDYGIVLARMAMFDPEGVLDLQAIAICPANWLKEGF